MSAAAVKPMRTQKATPSVPKTHAGMSDADARTLAAGDPLVTLLANGWLQIIVDQVRDDVYGDPGSRRPCVVIEAHTVEGRKLSFAPCDVMRSKKRGEART